MDWIEKLNQSISYIEDNLDSMIDYNEAAKIACCSTFYYQRMFSYIAGVSLAEYIRRRRMTKAALELQNNNIRIMDLAIKYGYDSPTSFCRAFQSIHNTTPSAARKSGCTLKTFPRLFIDIIKKGGTEMQFRIEEKDGFRIVGICKKFKLDLEENFIKVPEFWNQVKNSHYITDICKLINQKPFGILGVTKYGNQNDLNHYIAAATNRQVPLGMVEAFVAASTWVIFECDDILSNSVQEVYRRFYTEWLPHSGFEYAETYDIEVYPENNTAAKVEVWFAVRKAKAVGSIFRKADE